MCIRDRPGIYSLSPYSSEEIVTRSFLLDNKPDGIINIVDATNIEPVSYTHLDVYKRQTYRRTFRRNGGRSSKSHCWYVCTQQKSVKRSL